MADTTLKIDAAVLAAELKQIRADLAGIDAQMNSIGKESRTTFDGAQKSAAQYEKELSDVNRKYIEQNRVLQDLQASQKRLYDAQKRTLDGAQVKEYNAQITQLGKAEGGVGRLTKGLGGLNGVATIGTSIFAGLGAAFAGGALLSGTAALVQESVALAGSYEQLKISFTSFLQSSEKAEQVLKELTQFSNLTPFEPTQVNQAGKSLLAFGFTAEQLIPTLTKIGDISAGTGKDFNELATIFGKARTQGTLFAEDINQLTEAGIPIIEEFAKNLGVGTDQIKKLASEGKIGFADLETAFGTLTAEGSKFGGLMEAQSKTFEGRMSTLRGEIDGLKLQLGQALLPILGDIVDKFSEIVAAFNSNDFDSSALGQVVKSFGAAFEAVGKLISAMVELDSKIGYSEKYFENLGILLEFVGNVVRINVENFTRLVDLFANGVESVTGFAGEVDVLGTTMQSILGPLSLAYGAMEKFNELVKEPVTPDYNPFTQGLDGLGAKVKEANDSILRIDANQQKALKEAAERRAKIQAYADEKAQKERDKAAAKAEKQAEARAKFLLERQKLEIDVMAEGVEKEIALATLKHGMLLKELKEHNVSSVGAIEAHELNLATIRAKYRIKEVAEKRKALEEQLDQQAYFAGLREGKEAELEQNRIANEKALIDLRSNGGTLNDVLALEARNQKARQEITRKYQAVTLADRQKSFDELEALDAQEFETLLAQGKAQFVTKQRSEAEISEYEKQVEEARTRFALEQQARRLRFTLDGDTTLTEAQKATLKSQLEQIEAEVSVIGKGDGKKKPFTIFSLFGLDAGDSSDAAAIESLRESADIVVGIINEVAAARLAAADAAVQAAETAVTASEAALDREIAIAQLGYANNVDLRRKELEDAKANREKALKEKQKAARLQLAIDTAEQISGLASTSVNLVQSWSSLPFGVGLLAAAAQIGSMFALIASVRAKSRAISANSFEHGGGGRVTDSGIVVGSRHSDGGVPLEVEGGEFFASDGQKFGVVNRKMTAKHFAVIDAVNRDDREAMRRNLASLLENKYEARPLGGGSAGSAKSDNDALMRENNAYLKRMAEKETIVDGGDYLIYIQGNNTRRVKK